MKKIALSIASAALLVGCVDARHVQDPQGKDYLHISCSSLNYDKPVTAKCQARATKECPGGYIMIHNDVDYANRNHMILECDRDANNAQNNISRYTAFGTLLNTQIAISKNQPHQEYAEFHNIKHAASEKNAQDRHHDVNGQQAYQQYLPKEDVASTTTEQTVTTDKHGKKEVTKTTKTTKKDKKASS